MYLLYYYFLLKYNLLLPFKELINKYLVYLYFIIFNGIFFIFFNNLVHYQHFDCFYKMYLQYPKN